MSRIMALDFGSKTVGVAITDESSIAAFGKEVIRRDRSSKLRKTLARIKELAEQNDVRLIVIGYPVMLSGSEGVRTQKTIEFGEMIKKRTGLDIVYQDERLTTVEAYEIMEKAGVARDKMGQLVDQVAATVILEDYLGFVGTNSTGNVNSDSDGGTNNE